MNLAVRIGTRGRAAALSLLLWTIPTVALGGQPRELPAPEDQRPEPPAPTLFDLDWDDRDLFDLDVSPAATRYPTVPVEAPVYHLEWELVGSSELTARQEVRVVNQSARPWSELYFHLLPNMVGGSLVVDSLLLDGSRSTWSLTDRDRLLRIDLPRQLGPGDATVVALDYRLDIPTRGGGNYGILAYRDDTLSLAHAYALLAMFDEDGWDLDRAPRYGDLVYAQSAYFLVSVEAPESLTLVPGGRIVSREVEGDRQRLTVAAGPVRDFYIAAASGLGVLELDASGILIRGHAPAGTEEAMGRVLRYAAASLTYFGRLYGPYPYRELDIVVISTDALGVEFPGIIALRRELLDPADDEWLESTVVHEIAHQWFYGLVGNDQVSEPWLDESLTQYLTLRYYLHEHGAEGYREFRQSLMARWDQVDRRTASIGLPVAEYDLNEYGALVYGLGPLVIEWLAGLIGRPRFDAFLRDYVERFAFGVADADDFRAMAESSCACDLAGFFDRWIGAETPE
jgi:hypothetical protein